MGVSLPLWFIYRTHTSASLAINGFPTAIMMACAVAILPDKECSRTEDVLWGVSLRLREDHSGGNGNVRVV
jgi:hypothetical protein